MHVRPLALTTLALLLLTSGCLGVITGDESLRFEAQPAAVDDTAAANAGYSLTEAKTATVNRTFEVAGQTRTVTVDNRVATYEKALDFGPLGTARLGTFAVVTTPAVEIAGETLNPLGDYDNDQLVGLLASNYTGLQDVDRVSSRQVTALGTETQVTKYAATAPTAFDQQIDVFVHVTSVRHEGDFVIAMGVYPQVLDGEEDRILELVRALEHPAEPT
jgi:hypothetical protein